MTKRKIKILFLNQMAGPLFRELAEDLSIQWAPNILYTGHPDTIKHENTSQLQIKAAPEYNKKNELTRVISWFYYFFSAAIQAFKTPTALLFFVSNPPFLGLIGYALLKLRQQRYAVLVYDIHPDILINLGRLKKKGIIARVWRIMNRLIYENADVVYTIGDYMAANLIKQFDVNKTKAAKVLVVPPWVDTDFIKPIPKEENWFAQKYKQVDKLTILYSGNLGVTHNIEEILEMARDLQNEKIIHFLIIGEGVKCTLVENSIQQEQLDNITLLPFQAEETLPFSMATGDIAIVSMVSGTEGLMVPSKTCYYMAAGCMILFLGNETSEIGDICNSPIGMLNSDITKSLIKKYHSSSHNTEKNRQQKIDRYQYAHTNFSRKSNTRIVIESLQSSF